MSKRQTDYYKKMDTYSAVAIAEGFDGEDHTEDEIITAWQFIIDKKLYLSLQGWFGRTARQLIDAGVCEA